MAWRDEDELATVVQRIRRRRGVCWADWGALLLAAALLAALAFA